eukprot:289482-Chlamydomonas_euryale.AAC.5
MQAAGTRAEAASPVNARGGEVVDRKRRASPPNTAVARVLVGCRSARRPKPWPSRNWRPAAAGEVPAARSVAAVAPHTKGPHPLACIGMGGCREHARAAHRRKKAPVRATLALW